MTCVLICFPLSFDHKTDELTNAEIAITVKGIQNVYNELQSESVCDQLFRVITSVGVPEAVPDDETKADKSKGEFELRYEVTGQCWMCQDPLLFDDSINRDPGRALLEGSSLSLPFMEDRKLEITSCTCPVGAETRGRVQSDFVEGYNKWIEKKIEEGKLTNLRELLSLTEEGSFPTESQTPSNGAPCSHNNFSGALPVVILHALAAMVFLRKVFRWF